MKNNYICIEDYTATKTVRTGQGNELAVAYFDAGETYEFDVYWNPNGSLACAEFENGLDGEFDVPVTDFLLKFLRKESK